MEIYPPISKTYKIECSIKDLNQGLELQKKPPVNTEVKYLQKRVYKVLT